MVAQIQQTFLYEIILYEQFRHKSMWTEREQRIQAAHISYLDSLTQDGRLQLAGIIDQGLESHTGLIVLQTESYDQAKAIALQDPAVKEGMMYVRLRELKVYFKSE